MPNPNLTDLEGSGRVLWSRGVGGDWSLKHGKNIILSEKQPHFEINNEIFRVPIIRN